MRIKMKTKMFQRYNISYMRHGPSLHRALYRGQNALSGPAQSYRTGVPYISPHNGNTAIAVTTTQQRHFSAASHNQLWWHGKEPTLKRGHRYKWASPVEDEDVQEILEFYLLDSKRRATDRYPAIPAVPEDSQVRKSQKKIPETLNPLNTENKTPPLPTDPDRLTKDRPRPKYKALVIDCEMVSVAGAGQEAVRVGVVDFFTGRVLLNHLVNPTGRVTDWRWGVTRINKYLMREAMKKKDKVLKGWEGVRDRIFEISTSETIFIGHALSNDLRVLRIASDLVVDSQVIMSTAVYGNRDKFPRNWSLKTACKDLLALSVQNTSKHEALEDALATRELVLWLIMNPDKVGVWAEGIRADMARVEAAERRKVMHKETLRAVRDVRKKLLKYEKGVERLEELVPGWAERVKAVEEQAILEGPGE